MTLVAQRLELRGEPEEARLVDRDEVHQLLELVLVAREQREVLVAVA